jgi:DNA-binding PadR family transcriptional regulator
MAVRDALLALLTAGPAYGFQLHGGLAARTGGRRTINVGQTYATLERLQKQGLVEPAGTTDDGLPLHRLTAAGGVAAEAWLAGADAAGADAWDETIDRVLIARSLPYVDADAVIASERERWVARLAEASESSSPPDSEASVGIDGDAPDAGEDQLVALAASAEAARAEAAIGWLDAVGSVARLPFAPRAERPKRGRRPGSATATAAVSAAGAGATDTGAEPTSQPADA